MSNRLRDFKFMMEKITKLKSNIGQINYKRVGWSWLSQKKIGREKRLEIRVYTDIWQGCCQTALAGAWWEHSLKIQGGLCREKGARHKAGNSFQKFYFQFQWAKTLTIRFCACYQLSYFRIWPENYLLTKTSHCIYNKGHLLLMPCETPHRNFLLLKHQ